MSSVAKHSVVLDQAKARTHAQNVEWLRSINPDSAREIAEVSKSAWGREYIEQHASAHVAKARAAEAQSASPTFGFDTVVEPTTEVAKQHNSEVLARRKAERDAYAMKLAADPKSDLEHDPELTRLHKRVREVENVAPLSAAAEVARYRAWDAQRELAGNVETMKRATEQAEAYKRMTPSERELHRRAAEVAKSKRISHTAALGELMETSEEARKLYRQIDFERVKR
jgi:hypothetical protein